MKLQVKGINDGILIVLPDGTWDECCQIINQTVEEKQNFFKGANLYLDAGTRTIRVVEITSLREQLAGLGVNLKGIYNGSDKTEQNTRSLGLLTKPELVKVSSRKKEQPKLEKHDGGEEAFLVMRNVRSGVMLNNHESIIVIGDINPGSEVCSDKNVIVWGKIRGKVFAGKEGGDPAFVRAFGLEDAQITINGKMSFFEKEKKKKDRRSPLTLTNKDGTIIVDTD